MDCRVLPPRLRKEPVGLLERWPLAKARAVTRRSFDRQAPPVLGEREAPVARRGRALQGCRYAGRIPAPRAHLLLDDLGLAQADRPGKPGGARSKKTGAKAGCLGTTDPAAGARQRSFAPQARRR